MHKSIFIILILVLLNINAFALVASDVDMTNAISDTTIAFTAILGLVVLRHGFKKVLGMF